MKKNEIALMLLIVGVVVIATYGIFNALFGQTSLKPVTVKTAVEISSEVSPPSPDVFNSEAINPAVSVAIGDQSNQQPFKIQN